jgi:hypothetical protein
MATVESAAADWQDRGVSSLRAYERQTQKSARFEVCERGK